MSQFAHIIAKSEQFGLEIAEHLTNDLAHLSEAQAGGLRKMQARFHAELLRLLGESTADVSSANLIPGGAISNASTEPQSAGAPAASPDLTTSSPAALRTDGPTLEEYVKAGYSAETYPPQGFAAKPTPPAPSPGTFTGTASQPSLGTSEVEANQTAPVDTVVAAPAPAAASPDQPGAAAAGAGAPAAAPGPIQPDAGPAPTADAAQGPTS